MTEMSVEATTLVIVRQFVEAYNRNVRTAYDQFVGDEYEWREHPTSWFPKGRSGGRREVLEAVSMSEATLRDESIEIVSSIASGNDVSLEGIWRATLAKDTPIGRAGTKVASDLAMFLRVKNGKIIGSHEYVCAGSVTAP